MRRGSVLLTAIALAGFALPLSATAAPRPPARLGRSVMLTGPTGSPQAAIAAAGAQSGVEAFAWTKWTRPGFPRGRSRVQVRVRFSNGRLSAVQSVSPANGRAFLPAIGIDRSGATIVAWLQQIAQGRPSLLDLEVAVRPAGGRFGMPAVIGTATLTGASGSPELSDGNYYGVGPTLAVAADGTAVVAWRDLKALHAAIRRPARCSALARRRCFSGLQTFPHGRVPQLRLPGSEPFASSPRVAFGKSDVAEMVWEGTNGVELAIARAGGRFGAVKALSGGNHRAVAPSIGLVHDGSAVVAWSSQSASAPLAHVEVAVVSRAGSASAAVRLPSEIAGFPFNVGVAGAPTVLVNPGGEALVDWELTHWTLAESVRAANGSLSAPAVIGSLVGEGATVAVVMDARGDSVQAYIAGPDSEAFFSVRPSGGVFGTSELLPGSGSGPPFLLPRGADIVTAGWTAAKGTMLADIEIA